MSTKYGNARIRRAFTTFQDMLQKLGRREVALLVSLLLLAAGAWAFAELADEVQEGTTEAFDEWMVLSLRTPGDLADPLGPEWVEELGRDFTALGGMGILIGLTLITVGYLLLEGRRRTAVYVGLAIGAGMYASFLLKMGFNRPRPDLVPHETWIYTTSFPSGHSMMSALTYLTLATLVVHILQPRRRIRLYLLGTAAFVTGLVGVSRVYMGVHWPTDVLAGWTAGAVWALLSWVVAYWLQTRNDIEESEKPAPET